MVVCMIPFLLDTLTCVFIVGGLALLWWNLRSSRLASIHTDDPERTIIPTSSGPSAVAYGVIPDPEACRAYAKECLERADRSTNEMDREHWLRSGIEWIELSKTTAIRPHGDGAALTGRMRSADDL